jgi:hypothetical protein
MEEQRQGGEPIVYVGGLGEPPKRHVWPFLLLGLLPVAAAIAIAVFWGPIRSLGRSAGPTIAPYSLVLQSGGWSSEQKIATVPDTLSLTLANADQRSVDGITWRFTKLNPAWEIVGAGSGNTAADIAGDTIFFPTKILPNGTATFAVTMKPSKAMDSEIEFTIAPGHDTSPAHIQLPDGTVATTLSTDGKVRNPVESDADARLTALYDPQPSVGALTVWTIHVANTGPITINGIRLRFPQIPTGLDLTVSSDATVLPDGQTVQFDTTLLPGGQTVLQVGVTPHVAGHFVIPVLVYLGNSTEPLSAANGGPPLNIDVTVS